MSQLTICVIIFVLTLIGFAVGSKYVSITLISLISMVLLMLTGCLDTETALSCFSNSSAILMASMFIVAAGLNRTQMVRKVSDFICRISKGSFTKVLAGYVILTFILAQFIPSAVVCFCVVFPLGVSVCREMNVCPSKMMFSLGITAIGTVITLPLSSAIQEMARITGFLEAYDYTQYNMQLTDITFAKLPVAIVIMILAIFVLPKVSPDYPMGDDDSISESRKSTEQKALSPVREVIGYGTFVLVLLGMIFSSQLGVESWQVTLIGALVIVASGVLNKDEAIKSMNLSMVLLYVGALGIGNALSATGAADLIGDGLSSIVMGVHNNYLAGLMLFIVPFILTQFMLNLGVYSIFTPLYIMLCKSMGANPIGPIMLCMIACMTAFFTPLATPAVPVMMGAGKYTMKDLAKMGWIPFIVITIASVGWIMTVYPIF
ncbi:MAG TPA: anion permease [Candidatus Blautia intestinigallinarum]|nr:anion permease [Candidatus Blautia intestinigallinarum]